MEDDVDFGEDAETDVLRHEVRRAREGAKNFQSICLDIDREPSVCRAIFEKVVASDENVAASEHDHVKAVKSVQLPTDDLADPGALMELVCKLQNLEICILTGARRKSCLAGGLRSISPRLPPCLFLLDLSFNRISQVASLRELKRLKIVKLDYNELREFSADVLPPSIEEIYCRHNGIASLDGDFTRLPRLRVISCASNAIGSLPASLSALPALEFLDVSENLLVAIPPHVLDNSSLRKLICSYNRIRIFPSDITLQSSLATFDLRYNRITNIPEEIKANPVLLLDGNGDFYSVKPCKSDNLQDIYDVSEKQLSSNHEVLCVNSEEGSGYVLPCGIGIVFPKSCTATWLEVYCKIMLPEDVDFVLNPCDQLLSDILELTPNGATFDQAVRISIPYNFTAFDAQKREIVVRAISSFDGTDTFEDLESTLRDGEGKMQMCTAFTSHFTKFAVVSRLVENRITLTGDAPQVLWSSANPFTKLCFRDSSVSSKITVKMQALRVSPSLTTKLNVSPHVSDVIHLATEPSNTLFRQPIKIHLALPDVLVGKEFDRRKLVLLKWTATTDDWNNITDDVEMIFSTVDVSFEVNSFCRFWLVWESVKGIARQVYRRLTTYDVQFLVMQRKILPSALIAQCVRSERVDDRVKSLLEDGYFGEDPCTGVQQLMEGDVFKIQVMGELKVKSYGDDDRRHLEEKILVKRFHSQHPPDKSGFCRFCIEPVSVEQSEAKSGFVSFYKFQRQLRKCGNGKCSSENGKQGAVHPTVQPAAAATKRHLNGDVTHCRLAHDDVTKCHPTRDDVTSAHDDAGNGDTAQSDIITHLDDVLVILQPPVTSLPVRNEIEHELNYGELGTGMFTESNLRHISSLISVEWFELGVYLGLRTEELDRIQLDHPGNSKEQIFRMLKRWSYLHMHDEDCVETFTSALTEAGRKDIADYVKKVYQHGAERFHRSVKRIRESDPAADSVMS